MNKTLFHFNYLSGIKFLDPNKKVTLELTKEGFVVYENKADIILEINNEQIVDIFVQTEDNKGILIIKTNDSEIKFENDVNDDAQSAKQNILENMQNNEQYWGKIDNQTNKTQTDSHVFKNIVLYLLGICYILTIFTIFETPLSTVFSILAGIMLLPSVSENIGKKIAFLDIKRNRIILTILLIILSGVFTPQTTKAYIKTDNIIICKEPVATSGYKKMSLMEEINVYKKHYKKNGFLKTENDDFVKEKDVAFEGTKEFQQAKKDKEAKEKKIKEEKIKQEKAAAEAQKLIAKVYEKREKQLKNAINKSFDDTNISEYSFEYYMNPLVWYSSSLQDKKIVMNGCAEYGKLKTKQYKLSAEMSLLRVKILDSTNGKVLGKYSVFNGYEFE